MSFINLDMDKDSTCHSLFTAGFQWGLYCLYRSTFIYTFTSMLWCSLRFPCYIKQCSVCLYSRLQAVHVLFMLFVILYVYGCPPRFPYHIMLVLLNSNTTGTTSGAGTTYSHRASEFTLFSYRVHIVLLNLLFFVQCCVDHCLFFLLAIVSIYGF